MPKAETDTLATNDAPRSTSVPRGAAPSAETKTETETEPKVAPKKRSTGGKRAKAPAKDKPPEPLTGDELRALGSLMADAAALGQSVEEFAADLKAQVDAYTRMLEVVKHGG